jgi:hypothetical protein
MMKVVGVFIAFSCAALDAAVCEISNKQLYKAGGREPEITWVLAVTAHAER